MPRTTMADTLDLPPPYRLVSLREAGDAFAHASAIAGEAGAGTLVWVRRFDVAEFAVILEPEEKLAIARLAFFAGMNALADAVAAHCPPDKPVAFDWPDALRLDGGLIGGGRLGWPSACSEDATPDWLVFGATLRTVLVGIAEPGLAIGATSLAEEGADDPDAARLVESASRYLMLALDAWAEHGAPSATRRYLQRLAIGKAGEQRRIEANGDLLVRLHGATAPERRALLPALAAPSWFDPATGLPWL
jgi:hypothetical protein